jgi:hypothetical protein
MGYSWMSTGYIPSEKMIRFYQNYLQDHSGGKLKFPFPMLSFPCMRAMVNRRANSPEIGSEDKRRGGRFS